MREDEEIIVELPKIKVVDKQTQWFVFYVKAKHELTTERLLMRDGYTSYLPMVKKMKEWSDRKKMVEEPLFKSYIFIKIRKNQIFDILQMSSIIKNVKFDGEPAVMRQQHIDLIKELIVRKTNFEIRDKEVFIGKEITVKSGPFKGQKGIIMELRGKKRLLIRLDALDFTLEIEL